MFETNFSGHKKIWVELPANAPTGYRPELEIRKWQIRSTLDLCHCHTVFTFSVNYIGKFSKPAFNFRKSNDR